MPKEQSAGAVVFRMVGRAPHYLLLHYPSSKKAKKEYWDFPKGHVEKGETETQAALREIKEETGLQALRIVSGFEERIQYFFRAQQKTVFKTVVFFLAQTKEKEVKISFEHKGFQWLPFERALKQLKFTNAKQILKKVHSFLSLSQESS